MQQDPMRGRGGEPLSTDDLVDPRQGADADTGGRASDAPLFPGEAAATEDVPVPAAPGTGTRGGAAPPPESPPFGGEPPGTGGSVPAPGTAPGAAGAAQGAGEDQPLLGRDEGEGFRSRWQEIQSRFVDDPRDAVRSADSLVAEVMQELAATFSGHRKGLEDQWNRGEDVATEDLRIALQHYRSFFNRLLRT